MFLGPRAILTVQDACSVKPRSWRIKYDGISFNFIVVALTEVSILVEGQQSSLIGKYLLSSKCRILSLASHTVLKQVSIFSPSSSSMTSSRILSLKTTLNLRSTKLYYLILENF